MLHQYIVTYEIWKDGKPVKWSTQTVTEEGFVPDAQRLLKEINESAAKFHECLPSQIRVQGVFKL